MTAVSALIERRYRASREFTLPHRAVRYFAELHFAHVQLQRVASHLQEVVRRIRERHLQATDASIRRAQIFGTRFASGNTVACGWKQLSQVESRI